MCTGKTFKGQINRFLLISRKKYFFYAYYLYDNYKKNCQLKFIEQKV